MSSEFSSSRRGTEHDLELALRPNMVHNTGTGIQQNRKHQVYIDATSPPPQPPLLPTTPSSVGFSLFLSPQNTSSRTVRDCCVLCVLIIPAAAIFFSPWSILEESSSNKISEGELHSLHMNSSCKVWLYMHVTHLKVQVEKYMKHLPHASFS